LLGAILVPVLACRETNGDRPAVEAGPTVPAEGETPPESPVVASEPPPPAANTVSTKPEGKWLTIERREIESLGASARGEVTDSHRLEIRTDNVDQFSVDLSEIPLDWNKRIVLRVNTQTMELTKKKHPLVHFRRTPTGDWVVVPPDE